MALNLKQMYSGTANSPMTEITEPINETATTIYVDDDTVFPDAPNIAVIGIEEDAETIIYTSKNTGRLLGVQRGVEGIAKEWSVGTNIARNWTNRDYQNLIDNITTLNTGKVDTVASKGLSTNDYTTTEKNKLAGIAEGAEKNVAPINNLTSTSITAPLSAAQGKVLNDGKVEKISGKGLSTNDYTTEEKNKLANLSNYDDTTIKNQISTAQNTANTANITANNAMPKSGGMFTNTVTGVSPTTVGNGGFRNIYVLAAGSTPSTALGANGDICIVLN